MTAARRHVPSPEDEFVEAFVDMLLEDIAARPDLYGVDPAFFGLKPPVDAPVAPEARRRSPREP